MIRDQVRAWFVSRRALLGAIVWFSSVQYFVVQVVVAASWTRPPYDWSRNAISDLGAVACGRFGGRAVCSPWHGLMNASFLVLGVTMIVGAGLLFAEFRRSRVGFAFTAVAGAGAAVVGIFPEDTVHAAHLVGAGLVFVLGNAAVIVIGIALPLPAGLRVYSVATGIVGFIALVLYLSRHYLGLGLGGMERVTAYPQTVWLIVLGLHLMRTRARAALARTSSTVAG